MDQRSSVGVRELRQNLSVYLRRVVNGESLEVTDRGHAVALLGPLPERATTRGRLRAEGKLLAARGDLGELGTPPPDRVSGSVSQALEAERAEDV